MAASTEARRAPHRRRLELQEVGGCWRAARLSQSAAEGADAEADYLAIEPVSSSPRKLAPAQLPVDHSGDEDQRPARERGSSAGSTDGLSTRASSRDRKVVDDNEALDDSDFARSVREAGHEAAAQQDSEVTSALVVKNTFLNFSLDEDDAHEACKRSASLPPSLRLLRQEAVEAPEQRPRGDCGDAPEEARAARPAAAALARILEQLALGGCGLPHEATCFHAALPPDPTVNEYLQQISGSSGCSDQCLVISLLYIDRICKRNPKFTISPLNVRRLVIASLTVAAKFWEDACHPQALYAKAAGISTQELNTLESQFLKLIQWKLSVKPKEFNLYQNMVVMAAKRGGSYSGTSSASTTTPSSASCSSTPCSSSPAGPCFAGSWQ